MAGLALALRFVPYSDDHGSFDPLWTAVIILCLLVAIAASFYLVVTLEILKLRTTRLRELFGAGVSAPRRRSSTRRSPGSWRPAASPVDPETGEFAAVDPDTGEFEAIEQR